jgi:hypothetical protein
MIVPWAAIMATLGYGVGGIVSVAAGWRFSPADQWLAVEWGAAAGVLAGAVAGYRNRP